MAIADTPPIAKTGISRINSQKPTLTNWFRFQNQQSGNQTAEQHSQRETE
jgi:hypothetical protein